MADDRRLTLLPGGDTGPEPELPTLDRPTLIRLLLATYPPTARATAVLDVARAAQVAVAWEDRQSIEAYLGVQLTDEQWDDMAGDLEDFGEHVDVVPASREVIAGWIEDLARRACVDLPA